MRSFPDVLIDAEAWDAENRSAVVVDGAVEELGEEDDLGLVEEESGDVLLLVEGEFSVL